eukprot:2640641-Alexandrium_andersonii.AAC.1
MGVPGANAGWGPAAAGAARPGGGAIAGGGAWAELPPTLTSASLPAAGGPGEGSAVPLGLAMGAVGPVVAADSFLAVAQ